MTISNWKTFYYLQVTRNIRGPALDTPRGQRGTRFTKQVQAPGREKNEAVFSLCPPRFCSYNILFTSFLLEFSISCQPSRLKDVISMVADWDQIPFLYLRVCRKVGRMLSSTYLDSLICTMWIIVGSTSWSYCEDLIATKILDQGLAHGKYSINDGNDHHPLHWRPWSWSKI